MKEQKALIVFGCSCIHCAEKSFSSSKRFASDMQTKKCQNLYEQCV